jgi:hypothetical protein
MALQATEVTEALWSSVTALCGWEYGQVRIFFPWFCALELHCLTNAEVEGSGIGEMVLVSGKEEGAEFEVAAEAVVRSEIGEGEVGVGVGWVSCQYCCFTAQRKAELDGAGDAEAEGDDDAEVLVLQVIGVIGSSFNTSVAGVVETRLLPLEPLNVTTQEHVPPSPDPSTSTRLRCRRAHPQDHPCPRIYPPTSPSWVQKCS